MKKEVKRSTIGGQGVLDGVMMRSPKKGALAVRKKDGSIAIKDWEIEQKKNWFVRLPIVRGVVNFVDMLFSGTKVLMDAATMAEADMEDFKPSRFEKFVAGKTGKKAEDVMMFFAVIIAIVLAIALFFLLPTFLTSLLKGVIKSPLLLNLVDGLVRICILILYMLCCSLMKEIKDVYRYHGAEHKTVSCYEAGEALTVENVRQYKTLHPRCGTSYLLLVMVVTVLIYSFFGWSDNLLVRLGLRLLMLPVIAGIAYEVLKLLAKSDNIVARILRWPGMQLQRLTTAEPTDEMIEIAILAFETALDEKSPQALAELKERFTHSAPAPQEQGEARIHARELSEAGEGGQPEAQVSEKQQPDVQTSEERQSKPQEGQAAVVLQSVDVDAPLQTQKEAQESGRAQQSGQAVFSRSLEDAAELPSMAEASEAGEAQPGAVSQSCPKTGDTSLGVQEREENAVSQANPERPSFTAQKQGEESVVRSQQKGAEKYAVSQSRSNAERASSTAQKQEEEENSAQPQREGAEQA